MTQVGRLYEEEKQEALRELERKLNNENRKKIQNLKKEHRHTLQKSKQEQREILQKKKARKFLELSGFFVYINDVKNYLRLAINSSTSSRVGMTLKAPLRVVMRDAAAFAKVRSSLRFSSVRFSRPWSRT